MADTTLTDFHGQPGGVRWKLTSDGVFVEGSGIERTGGAPSTVIRAWKTYSDAVNRAASEYGVYCELILATMCTETTANPNARRNEPGWTSDDGTPSKVSLGLMQTLISTARGVLQKPDIDATWLLVPENSIRAGSACMSQQKPVTRLDPPLVACAYNAGGVYDNDSAANRWRMRQFPLGTSEHCDRFVKWFNDAVAVLKSHPIRPTRSLDGFLSSP
jgi:soluble lytic murein transglycosylase-like protein